MRVSETGSDVSYGVYGTYGIYGVDGLPWGENPFGEKGSRLGASALSRSKVENPACTATTNYGSIITRTATTNYGFIITRRRQDDSSTRTTTNYGFIITRRRQYDYMYIMGFLKSLTVRSCA